MLLGVWPCIFLQITVKHCTGVPVPPPPRRLLHVGKRGMVSSEAGCSHPYLRNDRTGNELQVPWVLLEESGEEPLAPGPDSAANQVEEVLFMWWWSLSIGKQCLFLQKLRSLQLEVRAKEKTRGVGLLLSNVGKINIDFFLCQSKPEDSWELFAIGCSWFPCCLNNSMEKKNLQNTGSAEVPGITFMEPFLWFFSSGLVLSKNNNVYMSLHAVYICSLVFPLEKLPAVCLAGPGFSVHSEQ